MKTYMIADASATEGVAQTWRHGMEVVCVLLTFCVENHRIVLTKGQYSGALVFVLLSHWMSNGEFGELKRYGPRALL